MQAKLVPANVEAHVERLVEVRLRAEGSGVPLFGFRQIGDVVDDRPEALEHWRSPRVEAPSVPQLDRLTLQVPFPRVASLPTSRTQWTSHCRRCPPSRSSWPSRPWNSCSW